MDDTEHTRRKVVGRKIKRARLAASYSSQARFASAVGVTESSIGHAESGSARIGIGSTVFIKIEICLGWPDGCIESYLATGDESQLPAIAEHRAALRYPNDPERQDIWNQFADFTISDEDRAQRVERIMRVPRRRRNGESTGS